MDRNTLCADVERYARDLADTLTLNPDSGNRGFRALLGDRRMSVYADPDRGSRVEGIFEIDLAGGGGSGGNGGGAESLVTRARHVRE